MVTELISLFISLCYVSGEDAHITELVDFITAAQIAEELEKDTDGTTQGDEVRNSSDSPMVMAFFVVHFVCGLNPSSLSSTIYL